LQQRLKKESMTLSTTSCATQKQPQDLLQPMITLYRCSARTTKARVSLDSSLIKAETESNRLLLIQFFLISSKDRQGRCFCADPFKVVNNDEKSTMKIDKDFHFGDIRIFNDEEKLEEQFVCKAWQKSLESDRQISSFASKIVKPDDIGGYACTRTLRANSGF